MNNLPRHVFENIANHLNGNVLIELFRVSRLFHFLIQEGYLWKRRCVEKIQNKAQCYLEGTKLDIALYFSQKSKGLYIHICVLL